MMEQLQIEIPGTIRAYREFIVEADEKANMITEAFGIESGFANRVCDVEIPEDFQVLYVTGESGAGKSTIARELVPGYRTEEVPEAPLYLWNGERPEDIEYMLKLLCMVGISDATQFVNTYECLSDSQQQRAKIALELKSDKDTIVIDEFLSTLDRNTARAVAYCIQKAIRKTPKRAILVTAHEDLQDYLMPDLIVRGKAFPSRWAVSRYHETRKNRILEECIIEYGNKDVYKNSRLGELHYKGKYTGGTKEYVYAYHHGELVGALVSTYRMHDGGRRISRVVVHPSYRNIGVGSAMVKKYIKDYPNTDVVSAMGRFNAVFSKAGMIRIDDTIVKSPAGMRKRLEEEGFDAEKWHSREYCMEFCEDVNHRKAVSEYSNHATTIVCPAGRRLPPEEIKEKIILEKKTAGRVLHGLRTRQLSKYEAVVKGTTP